MVKGEGCQLCSKSRGAVTRVQCARWPLLGHLIAAGRALALRRQSAARQRGAAMVEAMIMLLFFIIIFLGIHYWGQSEVARRDALQYARACAWAYSNGGCDSNNIPAICQNHGKVTFDGNPGGEDISRGDPADDQVGKTAQQQSQQQLNEAGGSGPVKDWITARLKGMLGALTGKKITRTASISVNKPAFLPNAPDRQTKGYRLTCNVKPKTIGDLFKEAWQKLDVF